ncbi:MAG: septal ring lytic transglycosylase RlpA family protein [Chthoniobacterales bacterium]|jgi:rare lipoprotein A
MSASWYDLPADSIAARRAPAGELTAAHDHFRIGTRLRVTRPENGRSVIVRVTDRGVPRRKAPLDLCRRAAEELDMIREGTAEVQVEVLPDEQVAGVQPADSPNAVAEP